MLNKHTIQRGDMYAFHGEFAGQFMVVITLDTREQTVGALMMPDLYNSTYKLEEVAMLVESKSIDKVDTLPDDVYKVCTAQYKENNQKYIDIIDEILPPVENNK